MSLSRSRIWERGLTRRSRRTKKDWDWRSWPNESGFWAETFQFVRRRIEALWFGQACRLNPVDLRMSPLYKTIPYDRAGYPHNGLSDYRSRWSPRHVAAHLPPS